MTLSKKLPDLSRAEFDILRILWQNGDQSVREVHDAVKPTYSWAYSTTKTMMDRMVQKGLLERKEFHRIFLYQPLITRPQGLVRWIEFFADRVLEVDYGTVVSMFSNANNLSRDELDELKALLDKHTGSRSND